MKKSLLIFTLITTLLTIGITLSIKNVQATTTEQFHEAEYIPNIWVNKEKAGKIRYQQARFLRRTSDNQFSYCIEPWEIISSDALYPDKIDINQLDDYTLNQIALIAYYGYGYKGHTHEKWYYITQLMIWEQVDKTANFYFTDKLNGNKISPFDFEIYEINELVQKHSLKPSFDKNNYTILLGENLNLVDTNRVLPSYITKTDMFSYTQSGDNITIESSAIGKSDITFLKKDNIYNYPPIIYRSSTNQDFLTVGSYKDITAKITVEVIGGSIELNKIDALTKTKTPSCKEASLIGSTFEIFNEQNTLIAHVYINDNTNPIIAGLTAGTYKIQEISAGPGYQLNKSAKYITLENTKPHALVTIENKVIEKDITIEKYYGTTDNWLVEPNITFSIYDQDEVLVKEVTTSDTGKVSFTLMYGTYIVKQKNSLPNYQKVADFTITVSNQTDTLLYKKYNQEITGTIEINKIDSLTKTKTPACKEATLNGSIFQIYNDKLQLLKTLTITNNNNLILDNLSFGTYIIKEIKAGTGYLLNNQPITITIDNNNLHPLVTIENKVIEKDITIEKYYGTTDNWLVEPNITFSIYDQDEVLVKEVTTSDTGKVSFTLMYGTYIVKQKNSLPNYQKVADFTIIVSNQTDTLLYKKYNQEITGTIEINKIDYATNLPITNNPALFKIFDLTTNNWLEKIYSTDNNGHLVINNLSVGKYKIIEVKSPLEYYINNEEYLITIDLNHLLINLEIKNERIIYIPNTNTTMKIIAKVDCYFDKKKMDYINSSNCTNM